MVSALILGFDPGTHKCGYALIRYPLRGDATVLECATLRVPRRDVWERVRMLADALDVLGERAQGLRQEGEELVIGFETPYTKTGGQATESGLELLWGFVLIIPTIAALRRAPHFPLTPSTVQAVYHAQRGTRRAEKKAAAVDWAVRHYGVQIAETEDDAAEALAVAIGAGDKWRRNTLAGAQGSFVLKGRAK